MQLLPDFYKYLPSLETAIIWQHKLCLGQSQRVICALRSCVISDAIRETPGEQSRDVQHAQLLSRSQQRVQRPTQPEGKGCISVLRVLRLPISCSEQANRARIVRLYRYTYRPRSSHCSLEQFRLDRCSSCVACIHDDKCVSRDGLMKLLDDGSPGDNFALPETSQRGIYC